MELRQVARSALRAASHQHTSRRVCTRGQQLSIAQQIRGLSITSRLLAPGDAKPGAGSIFESPPTTTSIPTSNTQQAATDRRSSPIFAFPLSGAKSSFQSDQEARAKAEKKANDKKAAAESLLDLIGSDRAAYMRKYGVEVDAEPPELRLRPVVGRSVQVGGKIDVAYAMRILARTVRQSGVSQDARTQRFHERAGLKRKRLRSERWRARFKTGFVATVKRVLDLRKQGW